MLRISRNNDRSFVFLVPKHYEGIILLRSGQKIANRVSDGKIYIPVGQDGSGYIDKAYVLGWHSYSFLEGNNTIPLCLDKPIPTDNVKRVFMIAGTTDIQFPADTTEPYFVGTGSAYKSFMVLHAEK